MMALSKSFESWIGFIACERPVRVSDNHTHKSSWYLMSILVRATILMLQRFSYWLPSSPGLFTWARRKGLVACPVHIVGLLLLAFRRCEMSDFTKDAHQWVEVNRFCPASPNIGSYLNG